MPDSRHPHPHEPATTTPDVNSDVDPSDMYPSDTDGDVTIGRSTAIRLVGESVLIVVAAIAGYAVLPLGSRATSHVVIWLGLALILVGFVFGWQIRAIARNKMPMLRAVYAMTVLVPMIVLVFSANYWMISANDTTSFSEPLSRLDAAYFAVTTLTTVGYGDIAPKSDLARSIVMLQMIINVIVLGVAAKLIFETARRTQQRQQ